MFSGAKPPPIIRKKVTTVGATKPKSSSQTTKPAHTPKRFQNGTGSSKSNALHARADRIKNERNGHLTPPPAATMGKRSNKRKAPSPSLAPEFDDSSSEESEISGATPPVRKRVRHDTLVPDLKRQVRDPQWKEDEKDSGAIIHGADLTWEKTKEFKSAFVLDEGEEIPILGLQYPSKFKPER
jgi:hypothetical protein